MALNPLSFRYSEAILCRIPDSIISPTSTSHKSKDKKTKSGDKNQSDKNGRNENGTSDKEGSINVVKCKEEYENLVKILKEIGLDVVELPPDNSCPNSFLVGDVAIVINGMGFVTKPKLESRLPEVNTMRAMLKNELDIPVVVVDEENTFIEGADILFTGREIFVGISDFTNVAGARFLAKTFPEYPCSPIKVPGPFHLTHYVNMASPDLICVGAGKDSQDIIKRMEREASFRYNTLTVPEDEGSNVIYVNGTIIHLSPKEIPESSVVFSEKLVIPIKTVELTELSKVSAHLARLVILLKKSKRKNERP